MSLSVSSSGSGCAKCGITKKFDKRSCCARGGAWFKKCGDRGDTQFDHTWAEGIQACKGFGTTSSIKTAMLREMRTIAYSRNIAQPQNCTQNHSNIHHIDGMSTAGTTDSVARANVTVCICFSITFFVFSDSVSFLLRLNRKRHKIIND